MSNITLSPLTNTLQMMSSTVFMELLEKDHGNVLRDMRSMLIGLYGDDYLAHNLASEKGERRSEYIRANGDTIFRALFEDDSNWNHQQWQGFTWERDERGYLISISFDRSHSMTFASGYDVKLRKRIVDRLDALEKAAALPAPVQTNPARVSRSPASDRVKALALVTREIARIPGVRPEAAATAFLAIVERDTGLPVSDLRHALPSTPVEVAFQLNPTHLAQRLKIEGLKAGHVNLALIALGLQEEGERDYVVTAKGADLGEMRHYTSPRNGHQGYQSVWSTAVVPLLATYFAEHPEAAKPLPRAPRKTAQKKTSTGALSAQAALL